MPYVAYVLVINGIYDLTCAVSILWFSSIPGFRELSRLHSGMLYQSTPLVRRMIAYGLMIHGVVRFLAGIYLSQGLLLAAAASYFIEAFCVEAERKLMIPYKATFVSVSSVLLGIMVLANVS